MTETEKEKSNEQEENVAPQSGIVGVGPEFTAIHVNGVRKVFLAEEGREFVTILLGQKKKESGAPNGAELVHILRALGFYPRQAISERLGENSLKKLDTYISRQLHPAHMGVVPPQKEGENAGPEDKSNAQSEAQQ